MNFIIEMNRKKGPETLMPGMREEKQMQSCV